MIRKVQKISFKINPNEIALNQRKFNSDEIIRGVCVYSSKKGKGSYNRKERHKKEYSRDDYTPFALFVT